MMKHEFEILLGIEKGTFPIDDYEKAETVYMWYPGIETKQQAVDLYRIGMTVIYDLLPRAEKIRDRTSELEAIKSELTDLHNCQFAKKGE